jgi:uncharacterized protein YfaS (alpha-2-macroglobulin family)
MPNRGEGMGVLHFFRFLIVVAVAVLMTGAQSFSLTLPSLETQAQAYVNLLRSKYGARMGGAGALAQKAATAVQDEQWPEAVRLLEELVGRALADQKIPGETTANLLHQLGAAWHSHQKTADEGLWAAYLAQKTPPRDRGADNLATLVVVGQILLDQITSLHSDFDYRGFTLDQIAERLSSLQYSPARVASEEVSGRLPADVRELLDLKAREESERMLLVDKITTRMAIANAVYEEVAKGSANDDLGDQLKEVLDKRIFYVTDVYADARRTSASICINFNLSLRADAGEYRDLVKVFPISTDGVAGKPTDLTVNDKTLCLHGLRHGDRYHVLVQRGLPSKSGATLLDDFDSREEGTEKVAGDKFVGTEIDPARGLRIPDRKSSVGFRSMAYILPKFGGGSVPLMTVNVSRVELELLRLSDRTLYRKIALGQIGDLLDREESAALSHHFSDPYWSGGLDLPNQPNDTITTDIPLRELLNDRDAEVAKLRGKTLEEPYTSEIITTGPIRGNFHIDRLSAGGPEGLPEEPGIYAFFAKANQQLSETDKNLEETEAEESDVRGELHEGHHRSYYESCQDEKTDRNVSCELSVQWFVVTDIGLSYYRGPEEFYVLARSLATGKPMRDVKMQLLAANNRVLAEETTDSQGVAIFRSKFTRGSDGNRLAAVTAYQGADFSFVDFSRDAFDLSDHGIAGRQPPKTFDAYVYSDRGVYRPDETIHATLLVRDPDGNAAQRIPPINVKLRASNGQIVDEKRVASISWQLGGAAVDLIVPTSASLGQADILVYMGEEKEPIGRATVQLDQFRPDRARISFVRDSDWRATTTQDSAVTMRGYADAQYLYGIRTEGSLKSDVPAANLTGEVAVLIQSAKSPFEGCYADFEFGRIENELTPVLHRQVLPSRTDANGDLQIDTTAKLPRGDYPLQARLTLTLFDEGGKVGQQSRVVHIPVQHAWVGVQHESQMLSTKEGQFRLNLNMIALDAANRVRSARLKYRIWRERNVFIWHQDSSSWRYQPDVQRTLVKEGTVAAVGGTGSADNCKSANANVNVELPLGRYYVEVEDQDGTRVTFRHDGGWGGAGLHAPTPDRITIYSDARQESGVASYRPGDTATFAIEAPFEGEVLLAIANDRVHLWDSTVSTKDRQATVKVRVDERWAGNSYYALATVYRRNADGTVSNGPARAIGATYFAVDRESERRLKLEIDTGGLVQVSPERPLSLELKSEGLQGKAWATVYAVDEGLISLNNHPEPDPFQYFFGRRALGLQVFDNYGRILLADKSTADRSGGDRSRRLFLSNYTSDRIVAEFVGPVEFVDGVARVQFDKPFDFNGSVRIAAVAWTERKVGAATQFVVQRQRIIADLRTPRFITPGDHATVALVVRGVDAQSGQYRVSVTPKSPLKLDELRIVDRSGGRVVGPGIVELNLPRNDSRTLELALSLSPDSKPVSSQVAIQIDGAQDDLRREPRIAKSYDISVRPSEAPTMDVSFISLAPNESVKLDSKYVADLSRDRFFERNLAVKVYASADPLGVTRQILPESRMPQVDMLERVVWQGMTLLYGSGLDVRQDLPALVREIEGLQTRDGYFVGYRLVSETGLEESKKIVDRSDDEIGSFERYDIWRTALALDFLFQARSAGIRVNDTALQSAADALRTKIRDSLRSRTEPEDPDSDRQEEQPVEVRLTEDRDTTASAERRGALKVAAQTLDRSKTARSPDLLAKLRSKPPSTKKKESTDDSDEDTSAPVSRYEQPCDEDMLYAVFVLAQRDALDRFDLSSLVTLCGRKPIRPMAAAMLAAALNKFGVVEDARGVLASIDARGGPSGEGDPQSKEARFDAMMFAFLVLAGAKEELKNELGERFVKSNPRLSLATRAWLARAYGELASTPVAAREPLNLQVEGQVNLEIRNEQELATEMVPVSELGRREVSIRNVGHETVTVAFLFRGIPKQADGQPGPKIKVARQVTNQQGEGVDLQKAKLQPNDLLYVVLTGERSLDDGDDDTTQLQDPLVIVDRLPAGFEVVDKDVFDLARGDSVSLRAALPSDGKVGRLRVAEARDDQLLAVVKPTPSGKFQIGYTVRVVASGRFIQPGIIIEDLFRSEISYHGEDGIVQVEDRSRP